MFEVSVLRSELDFLYRGPATGILLCTMQIFSVCLVSLAYT